MRPRPAAEMGAHGAVEDLAHAVQPLPGKSKHGLGGVKGLAGAQRPGKALGLDAHDAADGIELILLHQAGVAAAVDQAKAVSRARMLGGVGGAQRKKGVVLVAGSPPLAAKALNTVA